MGKSVASRQPSVSFQQVDADTFDELISLAKEVAEVPLVKTEYFLGGESIACLDTLISPYELSSIRAMQSYVAQNQNLREKDVEALVEAEFSVESIAHLRHEDFRHVIAFLTDLRSDGMRR